MHACQAGGNEENKFHMPGCISTGNLYHQRYAIPIRKAEVRLPKGRGFVSLGIVRMRQIHWFRHPDENPFIRGCTQKPKQFSVALYNQGPLYKGRFYYGMFVVSGCLRTYTVSRI
jgi:hypothetical protein